MYSTVQVFFCGIICLNPQNIPKLVVSKIVMTQSTQPFAKVLIQKQQDFIVLSRFKVICENFI
jgi:hypothetical protein